MSEHKFKYKVIHIETLKQAGDEFTDSLDALNALMLMGYDYMLLGYYEGRPYKVWHKGVINYERDYNEKL